ncbi:MAG: HAMP domain-containing histidine kinase [Chloroflexi bacterium]|nr:HAMP domain-containing histidine kinase [Chloroflexota bacterium]
MRHRPHRPPWWPAGEPWPPHGPPGPRAWHNLRGRFLWRVAGLFLFLSAFTVGSCALTFWLAFAGARILRIPPGAVPFLAFSSFVIVTVGFTLAGRGLRGMALPIGDMMEAAGRVAQGEYSVRVAERGPREVRALARAFNEMVARLQRNDEQRRSLMADIAHELRTPLTVIQGNTEGLLDGLYPRDDEHLAAILEETRLLSRLIDDLRTLSLAESGALRLQREPADVAALAREAAASFRAQADAAGVTLETDLADGLPALDLDPARIREVLANLIVNALQHTPPGGRVRVRGSAGEGGVTLAVEDTGAGIPPDELPRVFGRFHKSRDSGGAGLGLAIAKSLVEAHGGQISAQSEPGRGTTIRFTLARRN